MAPHIEFGGINRRRLCGQGQRDRFPYYHHHHLTLPQPHPALPPLLACARRPTTSSHPLASISTTLANSTTHQLKHPHVNSSFQTRSGWSASSPRATSPPRPCLLFNNQTELFNTRRTPRSGVDFNINSPFASSGLRQAISAPQEPSLVVAVGGAPRSGASVQFQSNIRFGTRFGRHAQVVSGHRARRAAALALPNLEANTALDVFTSECPSNSKSLGSPLPPRRAAALIPTVYFAVPRARRMLTFFSEGFGRRQANPILDNSVNEFTSIWGWVSWLLLPRRAASRRQQPLYTSPPTERNNSSRLADESF
ncbi:hypothetical protein R3P38DRAFT_3507822 [Favolaschia claudopus]|uniref:Uncharacterized protein n=1 Tax=Favolaschia claudopus TaxID=2862362 RepID=A0AAW0BXR5_9AGAR